jgi:3-deoxy-D-manno-octulosonic-acid transferase
LSSPACAAILRRTIPTPKKTATRLIYFLYELLLLAVTPAVALYLLYRGIRNRRYFAGLAERLGFLPAAIQTTGSGAIWFHAVSVGEVFSCVELIRVLRTAHPRSPLFVSTTTLAGRETADQKLEGLADGVFFAPLDYRSAVRRVLRRLRPAAVVVLETEIWPHLYRESKRAGASVILVNGRISDRALKRYRRWRWFFRYVLGCVDMIFAQSAEDEHRFVAAGARLDRVQVAGNLKYDFTPPAAGIAPSIVQFLAITKPEKIWIAASTMPPNDSGDVDEDDIVIRAFQEVARPGLLLILAPRRPPRFDIVAEKLERAGVSFVRRTNPEKLDLPGVLLVDSIGDLAALFERADVVFMGGTLARRGGHNILEPAYFAKPIVVGPHMENFAAIAREFHAAGAVEAIESGDALSGAVARLLDDPRMLGSRARELAMSRRGVVDRTAKEVWEASQNGVPDPPRTLLARAALTPLSWCWAAGHRANMARQIATRRTLSTPVISIGGLTMGGSGKSPMVAHLAQRLQESGRNPAILTRGYHRKSHDQLVVVPRGESASTELTGDEAQIYIRAGDAHVGIGADRYEVGRRVEEALSPGMFILDDGFQHIRLGRAHDIVMIDALDPFGGGMFPLGRSREPRRSLQRASVVVVNRVEPGQDFTGLKKMLRGLNPEAPIYTARVVPRYWFDYQSSVMSPVADMKFGPVAVFCGLGNPRSFWRTLEELEIEVAFRWAFPDHHHYRPPELERLAKQAVACGAETLLTTEKDMINLCDHATDIVAPCKLLWLKIGIEIDREEEFLQHIL